MRWILIGVGALLGLVALLAAAGYAMPNTHVAQAVADYRTEMDTVYSVLEDVERWPEWHPGISRLTPLEDSSDRPAWRVSGSDGSMTITMAEREPPRRMITLADGGMFVGRWTYRLEPRASGTRLTITEEARIDNPLVRGLTLFWSQTAAMERFLRALGHRLDEAVEPRPLT